jgi:hypothetical protein
MSREGTKASGTRFGGGGYLMLEVQRKLIRDGVGKFAP